MFSVTMKHKVRTKSGPIREFESDHMTPESRELKKIARPIIWIAYLR